jgi:type II secretory pathway pseudopilin PulG
MTLMEITVVIVAAAVLVGLAIPTVRTFIHSFETAGNARALISSSLAAARAVAAKEQRYAGIRFQHAYDPNDPVKSPQYMIFIVHDPEILAYGFRVAEGTKAERLPESIGLMELVAGDADVDTDQELAEKTTFSVVFSPAGRLVIHDVQTRNRDGLAGRGSLDEVFNALDSIEQDGIGCFLQDDDREPSSSRFMIYDRNALRQVPAGRRFSNCLHRTEVIHINPYTGTMIEKQRTSVP